MIEQLTEETITEYASESTTKQIPTVIDYARGARVGTTVPAKWWNWLFSAITRRMSQAKSDLSKMLLELQNVILHTGSTLDPIDSTQLTTAVQAINAGSISDYRQQHGEFLKHWEKLCPDFIDSAFTAYDSIALLTPDIACCMTNDSSSVTDETMVFSERVRDGTWHWHKLPISALHSIYSADFAQGNILLNGIPNGIRTFVLLGFKNYFEIGADYFYMGKRVYFLARYDDNYMNLYALNTQGGAIKVGGVSYAGIANKFQTRSKVAAVDFGDYYVVGNFKYTKATMQLEILPGDIDATLVQDNTYRLASGNCIYLKNPAVLGETRRIKIFNGQSIVNGLEVYGASYVAQTGAIFAAIDRWTTQGGVYHYTYAISFDGLTSTHLEGLPSEAYLEVVHYSGGRYYNREGYTSTDGIHWSHLDNMPGLYLTLTDIDGVLLSATTHYVVYVSLDGGATWNITDMDSSLGRRVYNQGSSATVMTLKFDSSQAMSVIYQYNNILRRVRSLRTTNSVVGRHTLYLS